MWKTWILSFLLITGCSSLRLGGSADLSREVEELKRRVLQLQQQAAIDELEIDRLQVRVDQLESEMRRQPQDERGAGRARPRGIGEEGLRPSPRPEFIEISDLDEVKVLGKERESVERAEGPSTGLPATGQALYDRGYTLHHQGRYIEAEQVFSRFLQSYGSSDLADNAQYWIAESRLARGEQQSALAALRETLRRYPQGNKAPDALFKVGRVLETLGDLEGARRSYLELLRRYPDSSISGDASVRIEELEGSLPARRP